MITEIIKEEKLETKADTSVPVTSTDPKAKSTAGTRVVSSFKLPVGTTANTNTLIKPRHDSNSPNAIVLQPGSANTCPIVLDPYLQAKMRPHQIVGLKFLYSCVMEESEHGSGAILADTMGLGKTLQCIALLWTLLKQGIYGKPTCKKFLVITPSSLVNNWKCEFKKWLGSERIKVLALLAGEGCVDEFRNSPLYSVLILSYEMFRKVVQQISSIPFGVIVCDEGHRLKNMGSKVCDALSHLDCKRKIIVTGTPIQNNLKVSVYD